MKIISILIFLITASCVSPDLRRNVLVTDAADRLEATAKKVESGKIDPKDVAFELRSCKSALIQFSGEYDSCLSRLSAVSSENKNELQACLTDKAELAKQAGEGAMVKWIYYAFIGMVLLLLLLVGVLFFAYKSLKAGALSVPGIGTVLRVAGAGQ